MVRLRPHPARPTRPALPARRQRHHSTRPRQHGLPKRRLSPGSVKVPAVVAYACVRRLLMAMVRDAREKLPGWPLTPGTWVSVLASWPIVILVKEALPDSRLASITR